MINNVDIGNIAAEQGVTLNALKVTAENKVNLLKSLGLGDEPMVEGVTLKVIVSSPEEEKLEGIMRLSKERCPGVYCLTNPIPLRVEMSKI